MTIQQYLKHYLGYFLCRINTTIILPCCIVTLFSSLFSLAISAAPLSDAARNYDDLAQISILDQGRIKPLDSFARSYLLTIYGRDSLQDISAIEWLAETLFDQQKAYQRPIFNIPNPDLLHAIGLKKRDRHYYSFAEASQALKDNAQTINSILKTPENQRSLAQNQLIELYYKTLQFFDISRSLSLILPYFIVENQDVAQILNVEPNKAFSYLDIIPTKRKFLTIVGDIISKKTKLENLDDLSNSQQEQIAIAYQIKLINQDNKADILNIIPPQWKDKNDNWFSPWGLMEQGAGSVKTAKYLQILQSLALSYDGDVDNAENSDNKNVKSWNQLSAQALEFSNSMLDKNQYRFHSLEVAYNKYDLFNLSLFLYIFSLVLLFVNSNLYSKSYIKKLAFFSMVGGGIIHLIGIVMRMIIMSRPPVTTLYESIIFVALIAVIFSIILELRRKEKDGMGVLIGASIGAILQFIANKYAADGDTMGMLIAVLNTNFWLATHVVTITIGYGCCFVGGALAHIYLYKKFIGNIVLQPSKYLKNIEKNILTITLIALFFTTLGTILGGIWADQSWGRFWGWDPKENGALLIVLWLIFTLHGKIAGKFTPTLFASAMVITNIIVALAWFGVNLLNVGLHSYGFTQNIAMNLGLFCAVELLFLIYIFYKYKNDQKE